MMKKLFMFLMLVMFMISFTSAWEGDNAISDYDEETETITFSNGCIFDIGWTCIGSEIGQVQLKTSKDFHVAQGYNYVWELDVELTEEDSYNDFLKGLEYEDMNNGKVKVNRDMDIKILSYEDMDVEDYYTKCSDVWNKINQSFSKECEQILNGSHIEQKEVWKKVTVADIKKAEGKVTLRGYTDVQEGDKIDWSPLIFGVRVSHDIWAVWTESLNVDIEAYYKLDEASGNAVDSTGTQVDGVSSGITYGETGIIIDSFNFTASSTDVVNLSFVPSGTTFTINEWVYFTSSPSGDTYRAISNLNAVQTAGVQIYFTAGITHTIVGYGTGQTDVAGVFDFDGDEDAWHMITVTYDDSDNNASIFIDGTYDSSGTIGGDINWGTETMLIGNNLFLDKGFPGRLDEVGIWSRRLTITEVSNLWNSGSGITWTDVSKPLVTLNYPLNDSGIAEATIEFNCSGEIATAAENLTNMSLYTNESGTWEMKNITIGLSTNSSVQTWSRTLAEGSYIYSCEACATNGECSFALNNYTFFVDTILQKITVESPVGTLDYNYIGNNETLNVTFTDINLESCWYNYNGTNVTIEGCLTGVKNSTQFTLETDNTNMTLYANDSVGNENSTFISWDYKVLEINQIFNNITNEGATEQFTINFTKNSDLQVSTVDLIYNDTTNSFSYSVSGNDVVAQGSITIPTITSDMNITFYYNITLDDGSNIITKSNNQTILSINVDNCSSFTNLIYNFTQYDEENQSILSGNNTVELQVNLYDTRKTLLLASFSDTFTNVNPVQFCAENPILPTVNYSSYVIVKYFLNSTSEDKSYSVEYYNILNQTIGNTTIPKNIALYNLKVSDTTKFRLSFRDGEYVLAPNILVQVHRQYIQDNDFKIVEIPITDSNGQTILNLVKDNVVYNFIMTNEAGEVVGTFNSIKAFCSDFSIGDCNINLAPDSLSEDAYDYNEEFDISISDPSYDNSTQKISISFVTGDLSPKTVSMQVVRNNQFGNRSVCSDSLLAASGILSCDVSTVTDTDQFLFISTFVEDDLAKQDTTNLNSDILNFGTLNGAFYAFLMILFIITMFMEDKKALVISLGLGWVAIISLGLVNGKLIGFTSAGIWILVSIAIFLWKLNKEESP